MVQMAAKAPCDCSPRRSLRRDGPSRRDAHHRGSRIAAVINSSLAAKRADILDRSQRATAAVATFYGHFPIPPPPPAIRAIVAAEGAGRADWPLEKRMRIGDEATGTDSIAQIHARLGSQPVAPHLDEIWRELGVSERGGGVTFDSSAPQAATRPAMTKVAAN
jgi:hypothetical protein